MSASSVSASSLDPQVCEQARLSRDARFDGLFFTAVTSTGIYCRPVCPAPAPRPRHIRYLPSAAACEAAGFRPCLRCRPELAPGDGAWRHADDVVAQGLARIEDGALTEAPLRSLADDLALSERHLRRLFIDRLGVSPAGVHGTRRLLLAKQLLTETTLPILDVAMAAGFNSVRRFQTTLRDAYGLSPRDIRRSARETATPDGGLVLRLAYRPPYAFEALLSFLRDRALPGLDVVTADSYARAFIAADGPAWFRVSAWDGSGGSSAHALRLELHGARPALLLPIVSRVRRMFDLDADPAAIAAVLRRSPRLRRPLAHTPGIRVPGAWDGMEVAARALLGQQVSVAAARTLATRVLHRHGTPLPETFHAHGFTHVFPSASTLADTDLDGIGLTRDRARALRAVARGVANGTLPIAPGTPLDTFVTRWTAVPGVGDWTAHYIAMRALSHPEACPAGDLIVRRALGDNGDALTTSAVRHLADAWRPWRAYAVLYLWRSA